MIFPTLPKSFFASKFTGLGGTIKPSFISITFTVQLLLEQCRIDAGIEWDDAEYYFVADELKMVFPALTFTKISYCAGILSLKV